MWYTTLTLAIAALLTTAVSAAAISAVPHDDDNDNNNHNHEPATRSLRARNSISDYLEVVGRISSATQCWPEVGGLDMGDTDLVTTDLRKWAYTERKGTGYSEHGGVAGLVCATRDDFSYDLRYVERAVEEMDIVCGKYVAGQFTYMLKSQDGTGDFAMAVARGTGLRAPGKDCKEIVISPINLDVVR